MEKRQPKRRFKDFQSRGDWEEKKLGDVADVFDDGDWIETRDQSSFGIRLIQTGNIGVNKFLDKRDKSKWISLETFNKLNCKEVYEGDILISRLPEPAGRACIIPKLKYRTITSVDCTIFRVNKNYYSRYIIQYLETKKYFNKIIIFLAGGTRQRISRMNLSELKVPIPPLEEQKKIGDFFQRLDRLIDLNRSRLDKLRKTKEAYLVELFPREGESYPRRRFPGFTGPWEEKKLGDVANYRRGSFPQPYGNKEWYGGYKAKPFVQVVDVGDNLKLVEDTKQTISILAQPKSVFVPKGKVIVTLQGSIGRVAITQYDSYVDRTILIFENYNEYIDILFWGYTVQRKFKKEKESAPGATIKTITIDSLSKFKVLIPSLEEQKKIGDFFQRLDGLIAKEEERLDKLENLKKAYLNELFV